MKIILVRDYSPPASGPQGAERLVEYLCKALIDLGHEAYIKAFPAHAKFDLPTIDHIPNDCDIVHYNQGDINLKCDRPYIVTMMGGGSESDKAWLDYYTANPHLVCLSKFISNRLKCPVYTWACSNVEDFIYKEKKEDYLLWLAGTDWQIYNDGKGLWLTIMLAKKTKSRLIIAGTGQNSQVIDKIKGFCDDKIKYVGEVNGDKKAQLLANAKAFMLPTQLPDACTLTFGEAMLSGTPVIASANGAMPELVNPKVGFSCKTESDYIKALCKVSSLRPSDCRQYGIDNFSKEVYAKKYLRLYENMLKYGNVNTQGE